MTYKYHNEWGICHLPKDLEDDLSKLGDGLKALAEGCDYVEAKALFQDASETIRTLGIEYLMIRGIKERQARRNEALAK